MDAVRNLVLTVMVLLAGAAPAGAARVDAVVGQVGPAAVTVSDIALARALGLFGFTPSMAPIDAADVDRYIAALGAALEAGRMGLGPTADEIEQAWTALEQHWGGAALLESWLGAVAIDTAWARRAIENDLRWRAWRAFHAAVSEGPPPSELPTRRWLPMDGTEPVPFPMPSRAGG